MSCLTTAIISVNELIMIFHFLRLISKPKFQKSNIRSSPPVFSGVRVTRSLVLMYVLSIVVCPFVRFLLAIVLSVLLRYTVSDCPFGIFKLYLEVVAQLSHSLQSNLYIKATHGNLKM